MIDFSDKIKNSLITYIKLLDGKECLLNFRKSGDYYCMSYDNSSYLKVLISVLVNAEKCNYLDQQLFLYARNLLSKNYFGWVNNNEVLFNDHGRVNGSKDLLYNPEKNKLCVKNVNVKLQESCHATSYSV